VTTTLATPVIERTTTDAIALGPDEWIAGYDATGRPLVRHVSGRAGLTFGVTYLCEGIGYDDAEAFDPLGLGAW
jgi:hypothetical protein